MTDCTEKIQRVNQPMQLKKSFAVYRIIINLLSHETNDLFENLRIRSSLASKPRVRMMKSV